MSIWGLPPSIVQAVQFHHVPSEAAQTTFSTLTVVHCADALASASDKSLLNRDLTLDTAHLETLGLSEKAELWRNMHDEYLAAITNAIHNLFSK
jgi:hypothetical protein